MIEDIGRPQGLKTYKDGFPEQSLQVHVFDVWF
jgi:hypothetical protein